jgi:hypothetical protein
MLVRYRDRFCQTRLLFALLFTFSSCLTFGRMTFHLPLKIDDTIRVNQSMRMQINFPFVHNEEFEKGMKKANDKVLYVAVLTVDGSQVPLSVSKYSKKEKTTIQQAFEENATYRPPNSE